jgi:pyruvate-formate lyase
VVYAGCKTISSEVSFNTTRLDRIKGQVRRLQHKNLRNVDHLDLIEECDAGDLSWPRRTARLVRRMCEAETVVILPDERIVFTRTSGPVPPLFSQSEWERIASGRHLHELGPISNVCADWEMVLTQGLLERRRIAEDSRLRLESDPEAVEFLDCAVETIDAVLGLASRYAEKARQLERVGLARILERVPALPPRTFHEALQALRLLHAVVWMEGHYHVGLGRIDQYLWPYLSADLKSGQLDIGGAEELLAEFFISLNKDSDIYPGVQQGDNGQTIMLGGQAKSGDSGVNELTLIALRAALYTNMIDPKINLRITPK